MVLGKVTRETIRVLNLPPESNESGAVLNGAFIKHSVLSASRSESNHPLRMMFAGRAAVTNAIILFDSGPSDSFAFSAFARQTDVYIIPAWQRKVRLPRF